MFFSEGSTPTTFAPNLAIGSHRRPPPQPISRNLSPLKGSRSMGSKPRRAQTCSFIYVRRTGLNLCKTPNFPFGFHHSAAIFENFSTSAGSRLERAGFVSIVIANCYLKLLHALLHIYVLSPKSTPRRTLRL